MKTSNFLIPVLLILLAIIIQSSVLIKVNAPGHTMGLEIPENLSDIRAQIDVQSAIIGPFIDASHLSDFTSVYRICTLEDGWQEGDQLILSYPFKIDNISAQLTQRIIQLTQSKEVFLDANFSASDLDKIKALGFVGIILKGGEEEKVGFKSFEQLDEILEAIFEE